VLYRTQLTNITTRLVATGAKLLYVSTTPFAWGDRVVARGAAGRGHADAERVFTVRLDQHDGAVCLDGR
jgi:hypothetical protein